MLRDIRQIPFKLFYTDPRRVAEMISLSSPVSLVQNDCALVVGDSILNAFDRLEVAEYSARSLIDTGVIGVHVPIDENEIRQLQISFSLT